MLQSQKLILIIACLTILSCGDRSKVLTVDDNTPSSELFAAAEAEVARGNGTKAGDYYLEIERLHPFTTEAEKALILGAQAYHDDGALAESRTAAERYLKFFPGSKDAALAQYLIALSYYDGIVDVTRDQERTFNALQALQKTMDDHPKSKYAELAKEKFEICLDQLAGKEMEIGRYYLARGDYVASILRFKAVIAEYPENRHKAEAHHRLIEAYLSLGLRNEAEIIYQNFAKYNKKNVWFDRSTSLMRTGTQSDAGGNSLKKILLGDWQ